MTLPRFTTRDIFFCVTLIAAGLAIVALNPKNPLLWQLLSSWTLIGAGLFAPFQLKQRGAIVGLVLASIMAALFMPPNIPPP